MFLLALELDTRYSASDHYGLAEYISSVQRLNQGYTKVYKLKGKNKNMQTQTTNRCFCNKMFHSPCKIWIAVWNRNVNVGVTSMLGEKLGERNWGQFSCVIQ